MVYLRPVDVDYFFGYTQDLEWEFFVFTDDRIANAYSIPGKYNAFTLVYICLLFCLRVSVASKESFK